MRPVLEAVWCLQRRDETSFDELHPPSRRAEGLSRAAERPNVMRSWRRSRWSVNAVE